MVKDIHISRECQKPWQRDLRESAVRGQKEQCGPSGDILNQTSLQRGRIINPMRKLFQFMLAAQSALGSRGYSTEGRANFSVYA